MVSRGTGKGAETGMFAETQTGRCVESGREKGNDKDIHTEAGERQVKT